MLIAAARLAAAPGRRVRARLRLQATLSQYAARDPVLFVEVNVAPLSATVYEPQVAILEGWRSAFAEQR